MNTTYKLIEQLNKKAEEFDFEHERVMIQMRIISEVERVMEEQKISSKKLSELTGLSASYITQVFRGNKKLNLETLAKFQMALNKKFSIKLKNYEDLLKENEPVRYIKMKIVKNNIKDINHSDQIAV